MCVGSLVIDTPGEYGYVFLVGGANDDTDAFWAEFRAPAEDIHYSFFTAGDVDRIGEPGSELLTSTDGLFILDIDVRNLCRCRHMSSQSRYRVLGFVLDEGHLFEFAANNRLSV